MLLQSTSRKEAAANLYFAGLLLLAAGLPFSNFMMSISQFVLAGAWLIDGNYNEKIRKFLSQPAAWLLMLVYFMHIIGLLWTDNMQDGLRDVRIKMPLLLLPFLTASFPNISIRRFNQVLYFFIAAVFVSTVVCYLVYIDIIHRKIVDIREVSIFISYIRLSLLCAVAAAVLIYNVKEQKNKWIRIIFVAIACWLVFFVIILQSMTVFFIFLVFFTIYVINAIVKIQYRNQRIFVFSLLIVFSAYFFREIYIVSKSFELKEHKGTSPKFTAGGQMYQFNSRNIETENGYFVWDHICDSEVESAWRNRSHYDYFGNDDQGNSLRVTLFRFLSSKGLYKDSAAVYSLSEQEIKAVERGVANVFYLEHGGLASRLHQIWWELNRYSESGNASGFSVASRIEYWSTAFMIIKSNIIFGVGTGDLQSAFDQQYEKNNSLLSKEHRLRAHNQYLSIAAAFGIPGLLLFLITLFYPLQTAFKEQNRLFLIFFITAFISMLTEDTLETQAGVTYYSFLCSLFLFIYPKKSHFGVK